jgi:serine/threonine protein kinase
MSPERWKQVRAMFDGAVRRAAADREVFLAQACAGDPELRAEVDALLADDDEVGRVDFLPSPRLPAPPSQAKTAEEPTPGRPIPAGYEILGELGRGGMGVVYLARQTRLNRLVALKMVRAGAGAGPEDLARFRKEAEAVARLEHPHIVHVYDYGDQDGQPWFSMEFVDGGTLAGKVSDGPQPFRESAQLVETLARAVQHAHDRGIVHRDLKPANVLLQKAAAADGAGERRGEADGPSLPAALFSLVPKIADFGLAKQLDADAGQTQTGVVHGTPRYMAPEQAEGKTKNIGPAADVYALGVILYELLTGRPPFMADTPLETLHQVISADPVPVSRLRTKVSRDLETICLKCLRKEPGERYARASALAEDLRRFLAGEPILARPASLVYKLRRWSRRNRLAAGLAATLAVSMIVALAVVTWQWRRAEANARAATANYEQSEKHYGEVREALITFGTGVHDELRTRSGAQALRKKLLEQVLQRDLHLLGERCHDLDLQRQTGMVYHYLGIAHCDVGRLEDARAAYLEAASLWRKYLQESPHDLLSRGQLAANYLYLGMLQNATGEVSGAIRSLQQAVKEFDDLASQAPEKYPPHATDRKSWNRRNVALCYCILGEIHVGCGRLGEAATYYGEARAIQEDFLNQDRNNTDSLDRLAETDDGTGWIHHLSGRQDKALHFLEQARDRRKRLVEADPAHIRWRRSLAKTDLRLGMVYHALHQQEKAHSSLQQAFAGLEPLVRENREVTEFQRMLAEAHLLMGNLRREEGRHPEALSSFEQARRISETLLRDNPTVVQTRVTLAESYTGTGHVFQAQGQRAKALAALDKAQAVWQKLVTDHPDIPPLLLSLAGVRSELARLQAEKVAEGGQERIALPPATR